MAEISRAELKYLVERQREEIKALNEAGRLLSSTTTPHEIIRLVASYLHRTFPVALCGILFLPQRKLHVIPFAPLAQVEIASAIRQIREEASTRFNRPITEEESPCVLENSHTGTWMQPATSLRSWIFASLAVMGQPVGLLGLSSGQAEAFTKEDHHAVGVVAEQLAAALRNAYLLEELRRADELKNQMLSIVSHELSTPLTAIKEGVNLVLEGTLGAVSSEQQDFLKTVIENADRLERITQKVKMATELMTGQMQVKLESFDLRTLLVDLEKMHQGLAQVKGVTLKVLEYPKPLFWQVDPVHLGMALSQLVENGIQATPQGGVVTMKLSATPALVEIQVADTGCGITKEMLPSLFEPLKSVGDINNRKMGGLGLGLFIAKALIDRHGGTIAVESTPNEGTWMTVQLQKQAAA